jgi:hypothetical protein
LKLDEHVLAVQILFQAPSDPEAAAGSLRIAARLIDRRSGNSGASCVGRRLVGASKYEC